MTVWRARRTRPGEDADWAVTITWYTPVAAPAGGVAVTWPTLLTVTRQPSGAASCTNASARVGLAVVTWLTAAALPVAPLASGSNAGA